jgi:DNA-directed RNA polymerase subunit RPC12/RpoP
MANLLCDIHNDECQGIHQRNAATLINPGNLIVPSGVLWNGVYPCSLCGSKLHSQFEFKAKAYVCAGCYNEFAQEKGWEK